MKIKKKEIHIDKDVDELVKIKMEKNKLENRVSIDLTDTYQHNGEGQLYQQIEILGKIGNRGKIDNRNRFLQSRHYDPLIEIDAAKGMINSLKSIDDYLKEHCIEHDFIDFSDQQDRHIYAFSISAFIPTENREDTKEAYEIIQDLRNINQKYFKEK